MLGRTDHFTDTLDICLERLRRGESVSVCLRDYPGFADELAPLLFAADRARRAPKPQLALSARQVIQRQLRHAIAGQAPRRRAARPWYRMPALRFALTLLVVVLALGSGVAAAQSSLPGSPLYPVKRAGEGLRLGLTFSPERRAALHMDFAKTRLAETLALLGNGRPADERTLDDLAHESELAWIDIKLAPEAQARGQRARFIAERRAEVAALAEALARVPQSDRAALETALRSGQVALSRASGATPSPPVPTATPAGDRRPSLPHGNDGQGNGQGNGRNQGNGQGQRQGTGNGAPGGSGQNNGGNGQNGGQGNGPNNGAPGSGQNNGGNGAPGGNGQSNGQGSGPSSSDSHSNGSSGGDSQHDGQGDGAKDRHH